MQINLKYYPDSILRQKCIPVNMDTYDRLSLATEMWKIMHDNKGIGLAAPQVGLNIRMFVWTHLGKDMAIWNPKFTQLSNYKQSRTEGCLSLPETNVSVPRSISSTLTGYGINKEKLFCIGDNNLTRIWQHEIDHLDGKLIIDYI